MENESELVADSLAEDILLPEDISVLRAEMYSQINDALSLGVFTNSEAKQWKDGFEACTEISHMENLIYIIDDFVVSGLSVIGKIEDLLNNELINESEKNKWRNITESVSFDDKQDIIYQLKSIIKNIKDLKHDLITILNKKEIGSNKKESLLKEFKTSDTSSKEKMIKKAEKLEVKVVTPSKKLDLEQNNNASVAEQDSKIKIKYQKAISNYLTAYRFQTARNILEQGRQYFSFDEYSLISGDIDVKEIKVTQKNIRLVA